MKTNIGRADRIIRVFIGLALLGAGLAFQSWWGLIGLLPLATAAVGWCWLYALLGTSTLGGTTQGPSKAA